METNVNCYDAESGIYTDSNKYNTHTYNHTPKSISMVLHDPRSKPEYKTAGSAGADLKVACDVYMGARSQHLVSTGVSIAIPEGYVGLVFPRSGLANKGVTLSNSVGVIDSDYRGEILLSLVNNSPAAIELKKNDRVAQIVFIPVTQFPFISVDKLPDTARGTGGFGSTGS